MKKILLFCLSILLICFGFVLTASGQELDDLELVEVVCPSKVTAGTALDVTVKVRNEGPTPITITRFGVALSGNPVSSIGGAGLWGPFPRYKTVTVPEYGTNQFTLRIVSSVPSSLKGKIAGAGVIILSDDPNEPNRPSKGGACMDACLVIVE